MTKACCKRREAAEARVKVLEEALARLEGDKWGDEPDDFTEAIHAAHPVMSGNYEHLATAMDLVGNRRSKASLVLLVNYLLTRAARNQEEK